MTNSVYDGNESSGSGVHWSAILGGAFAAAGITIILAPIGVALGLASDATPWHSTDTSKVMTAIGAIWLIIVQWLASGFGGYLTGRLRTIWVGAHTHEVFFRDTAHGFLSWAVSSSAGALILAVGSMVHAAANTPTANTVAANAAAVPADGVITASVLVCLSFLIGAFIASVAGALGGRHRDKHYATGSLRD